MYNSYLGRQRQICSLLSRQVARCINCSLLTRIKNAWIAWRESKREVNKERNTNKPGRNNPDATHSINRLKTSPGRVNSWFALTMHFCTINSNTYNKKGRGTYQRHHTSCCLTQQFKTDQVGLRRVRSNNTLITRVNEGSPWHMA